ncbi:hypothetical protein BOTBODRAFT_40849 [Botryobasidium botryosum FD-172 SS1]|uniref:Uncharacterized protein n=1 Tax=Botryobasidium botryosum (strain FD-172 SS1) TaxID=930990 RepID=A0A067N1G5_BOTB1|nr:hypothetical protein BOTBODRAFT_40849 [Botryobasidium botryosum FD-172 SS1]
MSKGRMDARADIRTRRSYMSGTSSGKRERKEGSGEVHKDKAQKPVAIGLWRWSGKGGRYDPCGVHGPGALLQDEEEGAGRARRVGQAAATSACGREQDPGEKERKSGVAASAVTRGSWAWQKRAASCLRARWGFAEEEGVGGEMSADGSVRRRLVTEATE